MKSGNSCLIRLRLSFIQEEKLKTLVASYFACRPERFLSHSIILRHCSFYAQGKPPNCGMGSHLWLEGDQSGRDCRWHYENHRTADWIQIFVSLPRPLLSTNVIKFLSRVHMSCAPHPSPPLPTRGHTFRSTRGAHLSRGRFIRSPEKPSDNLRRKIIEYFIGEEGDLVTGNVSGWSESSLTMPVGKEFDDVG